ncbi:MAG TPA: hypothetical protein VFP65_02085 [Anaeromyxobacteraceae bacterium]|nr:hypothetical protein [Anaeromyxobacteraceae bacterium]
MSHFDPEALLAMMRDPNCETQEIASAAGVPREAAGRAARLVLGIARAKAEDVVTLPPTLAVTVLRAAAAAGRADVLAAAAAHANRDVAKEGKRHLYVLRARGVSVPEPARPTATPPPAPVEPPVPCFASAVDGRGERAIWIGRNVPGKGIEVGQAVVSDQHGITELHVGVLGRKEYRLFAKDLVERGRNMGVAEVDREKAKSLVAAARGLNDAAGRLAPEGADAWLARLGPAAPPEDLAARFPPLPPDEEQAALDASARLHDLPLVRGWLADEGALRALAGKLDEIAVSTLYIDERQRAEAGERAIADAVAAELAPSERRERWASRLLSAADHLEAAGDPIHARLGAAAARALRGGVEAARIPFARLLVEKAFPAGAATPPAAAPAAPTSLIVPPSR